MSADTEDRLRLEDKLRKVLGLQEASTLLSYLPQSAPDELATLSDLIALEGRVDQRLPAGR